MAVSKSAPALGRRRGNPLDLAIGLALLVVSQATWAQVSGAPSPSPTAQDPAQRIDGYYDRRTELQPTPAQTDPVSDTAAGQGSPAPANDDAVRFRLRDVQFGDSVFLSDVQLDALAAPYKGREVGMADLDALVAQVNAAYQAKGITTARAVLSAQALRDGVLHVELIEGRLGTLSVEGARYSREGFIRQRLHQQDGAVVDTDQLRRDMVYLNRTTDLDVRALLRPGAQAGQTDVLINATEPQRNTYGVFVDNAGSDGTGRERVGAQAQVWGLLGVSDLLAGSLAYAQGGLEGRIAYSAIVNRANGRLGVNVSRNQIDIVNGPYRDLAISGESTSYGLDYRHPFVATQTWLLSGVASYARSSSSTDISGERIADTTSNLATLGLAVGYRGEGRELSASASVSRVDTDEPLRDTTKFTIANGTLNWLQRFGQSRFLYRANLGFQYSSSDFVPSGNLFQLGGVGSVRGYERGVLAGPRGQFVNLELHRPYGQRQDVYVFADWGSVQNDFPKSASIKGAGLGVTGLVWKRLSYTLDLSHPLQTIVARQDAVRADFRITANW